MKRHLAKKVSEKTRALSKEATDNRTQPFTIEITSEASARLVSNDWYRQEDIAKVAEHITQKQGYNFKEQFEVIGSVSQLGEFLTKYQDPDQEPRFIIYNKDGNHWVALCIIKHSDQTSILYKDSFGEGIPDDVRETLVKKFKGRTDFKVHIKKEQEDNFSCGPMSLKNMEIMMIFIKDNQENFIKHFIYTKFCQSDHISEIKECFKSELDKHVSATIAKYILELSKNEHFKIAIKDFVEKVPLGALSKFTVYQLALQDLMRKQVSEVCSESIKEVEKLRKEALDGLQVLAGYIKTLTPVEIEWTAEKVDQMSNGVFGITSTLAKGATALSTGAITGLSAGAVTIAASSLPLPVAVVATEVIHQGSNKAKAFANAKITALSQKATDAATSLTSGSAKWLMSKLPSNVDSPLIIGQKFPDELKKFTHIFDLLAKSKVDEHLEKLLKDICDQLNLEYDKVKQFFDLKKEQENKLQQKIDNTSQPGDTVKPDSTEAIIARLPQNSPKTPELDVKSLKQLLDEIVLGEDGDNTPDSAPVIQALKGNLQEHYNKVKSFSLVWQTKSLSDVNAWAKENKGQVTTEEKKCEALAVMDRANELITGGHHLRDTQILSVLAFLQTEAGQGKLCQINTGEGKTTIVSLLATMKILQGKKTVDIITSNTVLAEEGAKEKKDFYGAFGISVSTNSVDEKYLGGPKECYKADILYGSIGNFQFDYLKDSFQGLGTRADREFGSVILDEVDSMIIDNAGSIAKLSGPFPGMESLRYVYIKIWQELHKAEAGLEQEFETKRQEKTAELKLRTAGGIISEEEAQEEFNSFQQNLIKSAREEIKTKIVSSDPTDIEMIPEHLRDFAKAKLGQWIDNAIYAKYSCHENQQYIIRAKDGEEVIIPVDYANTGVTLKNTVWSHGLHQFVQLKHNLHLTSESLTSSFISNLGYIKKYGDNIFGLTGTLGSIAEQKLLSSIYKVSYAKIPPYKEKKFEELSGLVVEDDILAKAVVLEALKMNYTGRASLIICETIADLKIIEKELKFLQGQTKVKVVIKTYENEDNNTITSEQVEPGDIIVATNIAGRGTDFKTSQELEDNGGLHVCVTFLPCNERVEDQAFGRTSRQGKNGTAQLIIRAGEVENLGIDLEELADPTFIFDKIKEKRDQREQERITEIKESKVGELDFQDTLFTYFSKLYQDLQNKNKHIIGFYSVLEDLKESWAFWLEGQNFRGQDMTQEKAEQKFSEFVSLEITKTIIAGSIKRNPYYSIKQADIFLMNGQLKEAKDALECATKLTKHPEILYSAYIKLYEMAMESGGQMMERFKKALAKVIFINVEKDETYKEKAEDALTKAKEALDKEISYIQKSFFSTSESGGIDDYSQPQDFQNILIAQDASKPQQANILLKHLASRLVCLNTFRNNIECQDENKKVISGLLHQLKKSEDDADLPSSVGLSINKKIDHYLDGLDSIEDQKLKEAITKSEISELSSVGLDAIYSMRQVHDVPDQIIERAQGQISGGLAALAVGVIFPPLLIAMGPAAGLLISEGICDIVIALISNGESEFNEKEYTKDKLISYGIGVATLGIGAVMSSMKILNNSIKVCKKLSTAFKKSKSMQTISKKIASKIDDIAETLTKLKLEKLSQAEQLKKLSHLEQLSLVTKSVGKELGMDVAGSIIMEKLITKGLDELLKELKPQIEKKVKDTLLRGSINTKLQSVKQDEVIKLATKIIAGTNGQIAAEIAKEIALGTLRHCKSWKAKGVSLSIDTIITSENMATYTESFCEEIQEALDSQSGERAENNAETIGKIIEQLSSQVAEKIYSLVVGFSGKLAYTCVVGPTLNKISKKLQDGNSKKPKDLTDSDAAPISKKEHEKAIEAQKLQQLKEDLETLGLKIEDLHDKEKIKKAHHKRLLETHPDKNDGVDKGVELVNAAAKRLIEEEVVASAAKPPSQKSKNKAATGINKVPKTDEYAKGLKQFTDEVMANKDNLNTLPPGDKHSIMAISGFTKQHIIVQDNDSNILQEYGKNYKGREDGDNKSITLTFTVPTDTGLGHYEIKGATYDATGQTTCLYDALGYAMKKNPVELIYIASIHRTEPTMAPDAREVAEKLGISLGLIQEVEAGVLMGGSNHTKVTTTQIQDMISINRSEKASPFTPDPESTFMQEIGEAGIIRHHIIPDHELNKFLDGFYKEGKDALKPQQAGELREALVSYINGNGLVKNLININTQDREYALMSDAIRKSIIWNPGNIGLSPNKKRASDPGNEFDNEIYKLLPSNKQELIHQAEQVMQNPSFNQKLKFFKIWSKLFKENYSMLKWGDSGVEGIKAVEYKGPIRPKIISNEIPSSKIASSIEDSDGEGYQHNQPDTAMIGINSSSEEFNDYS